MAHKLHEEQENAYPIVYELIVNIVGKEFKTIKTYSLIDQAIAEFDVVANAFAASLPNGSINRNGFKADIVDRNKTITHTISLLICEKRELIVKD